MIKKVLQRGSSNKGYGFWGALLLLVIWWTVCRLGIWSTYLLPSPEKILHTFLELCSGGELFKAILVSLQRGLWNHIRLYFCNAARITEWYK